MASEVVTQRHRDRAGELWEALDLGTPEPNDGTAAVALETMARLFAEAERAAVAELAEALTRARRIIEDIDDYMKRPGRGDWGEECACCMGELLDDDRPTLIVIDQVLSRHQAGLGKGDEQ